MQGFRDEIATAHLKNEELIAMVQKLEDEKVARENASIDGLIQKVAQLEAEVDEKAGCFAELRLKYFLLSSLRSMWMSLMRNRLMSVTEKARHAELDVKNQDALKDVWKKRYEDEVEAHRKTKEVLEMLGLSSSL
jgi:ribosomal protein L30/L7E